MLFRSTTGAAPVNARDRIGKGPWVNAKGVVVATSVDDLHSANNKLSKVNSISEKGEVISGRGDAVNFHDILTGSGGDGRVDAAAAAKGDTTCGNWTLSGAGSAIVGHHDRTGLDDSAPAKSWNASHGTRGCDMASLKATGGGGLMYCFAAKQYIKPPPPVALSEAISQPRVPWDATHDFIGAESFKPTRS